MQKETSESRFKELLRGFERDMTTDTTYKAFWDFFQSNYKYKANTWAACYRKGVGINCNNFLESFHHTLKYVYFKGNKNKRLDKCINALLKYTRDKIFTRLINLAKDKYPQKDKLIRNSHKPRKP